MRKSSKGRDYRISFKETPSKKNRLALYDAAKIFGLDDHHVIRLLTNSNNVLLESDSKSSKYFRTRRKSSNRILMHRPKCGGDLEENEGKTERHTQYFDLKILIFFFFNMYGKLFPDLTNKFYDSNLWILNWKTLLEIFISTNFLELFPQKFDRN